MPKKAAKNTASETVRAMKSLGQAPAAWLIGMSARSLRDNPDAPRDDAGRYNAQELVEWATKRLPRPELTESEQEQLMLVADVLREAMAHTNECMAVGMHDVLLSIFDKHGGEGLLDFIDILLTQWRADAARFRNDLAPTTEEGWQRKVAAEIDARRKDEADFLQRSHLRIVKVCSDCQRVRRAGRWVKAAPPLDHAVDETWCPQCERKAKEAAGR